MSASGVCGVSSDADALSGARWIIDPEGTTEMDSISLDTHESPLQKSDCQSVILCSVIRWPPACSSGYQSLVLVLRQQIHCTCNVGRG